ncbi:hypothetical protein [Paenibacillus gansuensis]|uniref:Uncharacterized protein n=1 Tax=Paenibacillus gansuensis TaxID=306542 RepID=A0ABW5P8Q9_9BACL
MKIELDDLLPCLKGNVEHKYYKGHTNIYENNCVARGKCEYINPRFQFFLEKEYSDFALEKLL